MERTDQQPHQHSPAAVRAALAAQITDFRIMRRTEIAPGWWAQPREVGDTPSATAADSFCREQNAVTMDLNRSKRIEYYAEPVFATETEPLPPAAASALARLELRLNHPTTRQTPARPQHTPTRARCTGDCTTTTQLPTTGWTKDKWGWLCPTHTHARTDRPAVHA